MASSSRRRRNEDSSELSLYYNRILFASCVSRQSARGSSGRCKVQLVGSAASDVHLNGSDVDYLLEPRDIIIAESSIMFRDDLPCYVRISTECLTGLVPQVLLGKDGYMLADPVRNMAYEIFGNTLKYRQASKVGKKTISHTVCGNISTDVVPQLRISGLPRTARSFTTRDRLWPSDDIISIITTGEFHLAARPAPLDPDPEHDFCLSFAKAEVVLLRTMSADQRLIIHCLKIIGCLIDNDRGVLTSYHMKTSALWYFEKTDARSWERNHTVVCILESLDQYLNDRFLPHYFVREMNLFADVSESALIDVRRSLWSFLGVCLATDDIAGLTSYARLRIAINIIQDIQMRLSDPNPERDYMCDIENIMGASEVMYGTGNAFNLVTKQKISEYVININPVYIDELKTELTSMVDGDFVPSKQLRFIAHSNFVPHIFLVILNSTDKILEEFFGMISAEKVRRNAHSVSRKLRNSKQTMNTWLAFTDDLTSMLMSQLSKIVDKVLRGMSQTSRDERCVGNDQCEENIDTLFDQVTKDLLSFAVGHIETFRCPVDIDTYAFRSVAVGDALENIDIFRHVMERCFLPVECAIVMSVRLKACRGSGDQATRIMNPESLEYRCYAAFYTISWVALLYNDLYLTSCDYQQWMEFITTIIRGRDQQHCSQP